MDLSLILTMAAEGAPDRPAVGRRSDALTYGGLLDRARRAAGLIADSGVERVGLVDVNSAAVPILLFASSLAGTPFAPVNYRLADDRLGELLARLAPALVVAADDACERVAAQGIVVESRSAFLARLDEAEPVAGVPGDPDEVCVLLFTSGTTGDPKAALLRHRHVVSYVISTVDFLGAGPEEAALVSVPPYHIAGISAVLSSVYAGRRLVYLESFDPAEWVRVVRDEEITHAMVVPTMLGRILEVLDRDGTTLPSLRHLSYGGGRMPRPLVELALERLPEVDFVNAYGLTETSSTVAILGPLDHRTAVGSEDPVVRARLGSVGRPVPGIELEIRDDTGRALASGEPGEVWLRGDQVSGEYDGQEGSDTAGWFHTKDRGRLDEAGYLYIEGRSDDVIVRGGENMSPGEIEEVLLDHPAVEEVAVVAVESEEWGQVPVAVVVLAGGAMPSEEDLRGWVRDRLRSSRTPERVLFVAELPYTETGKLLRRVVRDSTVASLAS